MKVYFLIFALLAQVMMTFALKSVGRTSGALGRTMRTATRLSMSTTILANPVKLMGAKDTADSLLSKTDVFIFDCDGVIWKVWYALSIVKKNEGEHSMYS